MVLRAFSALCVYSKFRHHPHPPGYLCAKFCFCGDLRCRASSCRKIAYSITHSINHPAYLMPQEHTNHLSSKHHASDSCLMLDCVHVINFCTILLLLCMNDRSARSMDRAARSRCAIDGSLVSASIGRSCNHRSIAQCYLCIGLSTFVLLL